MAKWFAPNISSRGRIFRGVCGLVIIAGAIVVSQWSLWPAAALAVAGGFVVFEAVRGWCVMRACGIKTKL